MSIIDLRPCLLVFTLFIFQIYDGRIEDNNVIGTYCGHEADIDILATQSVITVYFSSDYMTGSQGFNATFMPGIVLYIFQCKNKQKLKIHLSSLFP